MEEPYSSMQAPLIAVIAFGLYLFLLLAIGVAQFRDCPEDAEALRKVCSQIRRIQRV